MPAWGHDPLFDGSTDARASRSKIRSTVAVLRINAALLLILALALSLAAVFAIKVGQPQWDTLSWGPSVPNAGSDRGLERLAFAGPAWRGPNATAIPQAAASARPLPLPPYPGVETHALLSGPRADPLATVLLQGLPDDVSLSDGVRIGSSRWAVAVGQLDNLVVQLPPPREVPIRTVVELRSRAGLPLHSFTLELRQSSLAAVAAPVLRQKPTPVSAKLRASGTKPTPVPRKAKTKPKVAAAGPKLLKPVAEPVPQAKLVPVAAATPAKAIQAGASAGLQPALTLLPPPGALFSNPDPKDTATSGLALSARDDPRFMILRGLGMKPAGE